MKIVSLFLIIITIALILSGCAQIMGWDRLAQIEADGNSRIAQAEASGRAAAAQAQADGAARSAEARAAASVERAGIWAGVTPAVTAIVVAGAVISILASGWAYVNRHRTQPGTALATTTQSPPGFTADELADALYRRAQAERERAEREAQAEAGYVVDMPRRIESPHARMLRLERGGR